MKSESRKFAVLLVVLAGALGGCATGIENVLSTPKVELRDVQVVGLGFRSQTFLLSFDISNPNPFALPVDAVKYAVRLDGQRFASGETASEFTVPAGRSSQFAISVDLDLLQTAPQLLSIVRDGVRKDIGYELEGQLTVGIPLAPPVSYRSRGTIRLHSEAF